MICNYFTERESGSDRRKTVQKNETVKTIQTGIDGVATTSADLLPYGKYKLEETKAPEGYLTDGAKAIEFSITENGKIVDLTDESHSIYNQIKRGDLEQVHIRDLRMFLLRLRVKQPERAIS